MLSFPSSREQGTAAIEFFLDIFPGDRRDFILARPIIWLQIEMAAFKKPESGRVRTRESREENGEVLNRMLRAASEWKSRPGLRICETGSCCRRFCF